MIDESETYSPGKFNFVLTDILMELMKTCRIEENIDSGREKFKFCILTILCIHLSNICCSFNITWKYRSLLFTN
jgi:hypothetical protein